MTTLREEIQNIIYMRMGGKERVSLPWTECGEATKDIIKLFEKRIDDMIKEESQGSIYHLASDSVLTLKQVKEMLK